MKLLLLIIFSATLMMASLNANARSWVLKSVTTQSGAILAGTVDYNEKLGEIKPVDLIYVEDGKVTHLTDVHASTDHSLTVSSDFNIGSIAVILSNMSPSITTNEHVISLDYYVGSYDGDAGISNYYGSGRSILWRSATAMLPNSWMNNVSDSKSLAYLSIPGTHDSAAYQLDSSTEPFITEDQAKAQDYSIYEQLMMGVRYLDIRCWQWHDSCQLFHGIAFVKQNLHGALDEVTRFLRENPSETVIMSIKCCEAGSTLLYGSQENTLSFDNLLYNYTHCCSADWSPFFLENRIPKLGEVRGKIVLVRRFDADKKWGNLGYDVSDWPDMAQATGVSCPSKDACPSSVEHDSTSFNKNIRYWVQDYYYLGTFKVWEDVTSVPQKTELIKRLGNISNALGRQYDAADGDKGSAYIFNFTSGYILNWGPVLNTPSITSISSPVNLWVYKYIQTIDTECPMFGVVAFDRIDKTLASLVFNANSPIPINHCSGVDWLRDPVDPATSPVVPDIRASYNFIVSTPINGSIRNESAGINCGTRLKKCKGSAKHGSIITHVAHPKPGYRTKMWRGCDSVIGDTCLVKVTKKPPRVSVRFAKIKGKMNS